MPGSLGDKLRELRGSMSLREASRKTGLSHTYISQLENGIDPRSGKEIFPSLPVLEQIADGYGIPREELLIIVGYLKSPNDVKNDKGPIDNLPKKSDNSTHTDKQESGFRFFGVGADFFPMGRLVQVPIVAEISCGEPIFTEDNIIGTMPVDSSIVPINQEGEYVWVRANGDSMMNANITDGSLVLLHLQPEVENGDIAAVCVDSENATLKRVYISDTVATLVPENPSMRPMVYDLHRIRIIAKAVWVSTKL